MKRRRQAGWPAQPASRQPYQYTSNNPLCYTGPSGHNPFCFALALADGPPPVGDAGAILCVVLTVGGGLAIITAPAPPDLTTPPIPLRLPQWGENVLLDPALLPRLLPILGVSLLPPELRDQLLADPLWDVCLFPPVTGIPWPGTQWPPVLFASPNQMNREIQTGKAPSGIMRVDRPKIPGEQLHVHFDNGAALNVDGTGKHE